MVLNQNSIFKKEKPIEEIYEDQIGLNRANFAENLAINIENYLNNNTDCLTIGLMGKWGSGKTSIINLTKKYINEDIKIMEFNPWIYSSYNQLIGQFFDELISQFSDETIIRYLKAYWIKLDKSDLIKSASKHLINAFSKEFGDFIEENMEMDSVEESLKKIKDNINKELEKHKIICIMDDFDRITSDEIKEMFRLIKIMADFDNIIYLISFDKNIVKNALNETYGEDFIEKIINVPLDVPLATHEELRSMLKENVIKISKIHSLDLDEDRLDSFLDFSIYENPQNFGISYLFKNVRDIKRFLNILEFNIELIKNEVNFVDFIVITSVQLLSPNVYEKIKHNESLLTEYKIPMEDYSSNNDFVTEEQEKFESITCGDDNIKYILERLFPKMHFIYHPRYYSHDEFAYDSKLLICSENHFKTYFKLNPIVKNITENEIRNIIELINSKKEQEIINEIRNLLETDKFKVFFERLPGRIKNIKTPEFFIELIFSFDEKLSDDFLDLNSYYIKKTCLWLLNIINKENRLDILKKQFKKSKNIYFNYKLIRFIEVNKYMPYEKEPLFIESEIEELKNIIKEEYPKFLLKYSEIPNEHFKGYLEIGTFFELKSENDEFINKLISSKNGLLIFLNSLLDVNEEYFINSEINNINYFSSMETIKEKLDNYIDEIQNEEIVKKFLIDYEVYKNRIEKNK